MIHKLRAVLDRVRGMEIPLHGAHTCYFMALSALPSLVVLLGLLRHTALEPEDLMELGSVFLPETLQGLAWQLIVSAEPSRRVLSFSALAALWSAGRGMYGILRGLNAVAGLREDRSWLRVRLVSAGYTLLFILVVLMTLTFHVFGGKLIALLKIRGLGGLRFAALLVAQTLVFTAMYMFLPCRRGRLGECFPGAVLASLGWTAVSAGFSWYAGRFHGGVYLTVMGMVWLYACICVIFAGAALNRLLAAEAEGKL